MNEIPDEAQRLQQLLERMLRDLPNRRAPQGLESQVLEEIVRRAQPWWRQSFAHWPSFARIALVLACVLLSSVAFMGNNWTDSTVLSLRASGALSLSSARQLLSLITAAGELAALLANAVPAPWLCIAGSTAAVLYVLLFGLGAAAYRTLYLTPSNGR